MELTPSDREELPTFMVSIFDNGETVHTSWFDTLAECERFAEEWTERVPGTRAEIEDQSHDPSIRELVEATTAIVEDYPREEGDQPVP